MKTPKYMHKEITRHGREVFYFRRGRVRHRLPDDFGSEAFWDAYKQALNGRPILHVRDMSATKSAKRKAEIDRTLRVAVNRAKLKSKAKALPFDLTVEWAQAEVARTNYRCPLTHIPFLFDTDAVSFMRPYAPSLDRIEPTKGYVVGNVRVVIFAINAMIADWGEEVMHRVANGYRFVRSKNRQSIPAP